MQLVARDPTAVFRHYSSTTLIILKHRSVGLFAAAASSLNTAAHLKIKPLIRTMYEKRKSGGGEGQWKTGGG